MALQTAVLDSRLIELPSRPVTGGELSDVFALEGVRMDFARDEEIFGQGEPAEFVYLVVSGAVRLSRLLSDGRRQVSDFLLPGDIFGLEAQTEHRLGGEAVCATVLTMVRRRTIVAAATRDISLAASIWSQTVHNFQRAQDHMLLLGRQSACERLCAFLLDLADRQGTHEALELPMSRQDIADYLGLTIETVSRTLTQLQGAGWIRLPAARRVILSERRAIERLCS